jgi:signal transduction histidine kinase
MKDLSPAWNDDRMTAEWLPMATRHGSVSGEGAILTRAGTEVPVSFVLLVHQNDRGDVEYMSTIARDISTTKELEQKLRVRAEELAAANQAKDDFLATLSHELRTPLNVVRGRTAMLKAGVNADALARAVDVIQRNTALLQTLVDDLLDVSRLRRGHIRLDCAAVQLAPILEAAVQAVEPARSARAIRIATTIPKELPAVWADAARLQQVIWNLLANAVKFTSERGTVELMVRPDRASVVVSVRDNGIGIASDALQRVFEPFWQADASATRQFSGLGLGLSIARNIVELHGGQIWAESDGLQRGATFNVRLPVSAGRLSST